MIFTAQKLLHLPFYKVDKVAIAARKFLHVPFLKEASREMVSLETSLPISSEGFVIPARLARFLSFVHSVWQAWRFWDILRIFEV